MNNNLKTVLPLLLAMCAGPVFSLDVTPGNVPQADCPIFGFDTLYKLGSVSGSRGSIYLPKEKKTGAGKTLNPGDLVYYVSIVEGEKSYSTEKQIEIIDKQPLARDAVLKPGEKYKLTGRYVSKKGQKYDLVSMPGFIVMVDEKGFICSTKLTRELGTIGIPTVYQEKPLIAQIEEAKLPDTRSASIAITLKEFDSATFTLDVSFLTGGKVKAKRALSFDLIAGKAKIGDLEITASRSGNGLEITSIVEPTDFAAWQRSVYQAVQ